MIEIEIEIDKLKILDPDRKMSVSTDLVNKNKKTNTNTNTSITLLENKPGIRIHSVLTEGLSLSYKMNMLDAMKTNPYKQRFELMPIQLLVEAEEEELNRLVDSQSPSFLQLKSTFQLVAETVSANIILFIGHINLCTQFMDKYNFKDQINPKYPTIVLVVGCHSEDELESFHKRSSLQKLRYYFMGFEDLVHCIDGSIYMCEHPHVNVPNMECRFPGSETSVNELYNTKQGSSTNWNYTKLNNQTSTNPVLKCIDAKFQRFINTYKEDINRRNCSKVTAETLIGKINKLKNSDGSFKQYSQLSFPDLSIQRSDLLSCSSANRCAFKLNTEADRVAREFDKQVKGPIVFYEIVELMDSLYSIDEDEHRAYDMKIVSYLNSLSKEQAIQVLQADVPRKRQVSLPLFFLLFIYKFTISIKEILTKYYEINWETKSLEKLGLITYLIEQLEQPKVVTTNLTSIKYEYEYTYYRVKELFRLFLKLYEKNHGLFILDGPPPYAPFSLLLHQNFTQRIPLIKFYLKYFPGKTSSNPNAIDYNAFFTGVYSKSSLLEIVLRSVYPQNNEFKFLLEALFVYGVNPSKPIASTMTSYEASDTKLPLDLYEESAETYLDSEVIKLFFIYDQRNSSTSFNNSTVNKKFIEERLIHYQIVASDPKLLNSLKSDLEKKFQKEVGYDQITSSDASPHLKHRYTLFEFRKNNLQEFVRKAIASYIEVLEFLETADVKSLRKTPEDIERQLDIDLAPYMLGFRAIPQIKELYGTMQKYLKKQKMDPLLKEEFIEEAAQVYTSKKPLENEGNSAVRRLEILQDKFAKMKNIVQNYTSPPKQGGNRKTRRYKQNGRRKTRHSKRSTD